MKFSELSVNQKFTYNSVEYVRINDERINCCTTARALNLTDNSKHPIADETDVELVA